MLRAVRVSKLGPEYESRSGYLWQWYALVMDDGTERHTAVPAGPRASKTSREPTGAGHWHRPDLPRVSDGIPCPGGCR